MEEKGEEESGEGLRVIFGGSISASALLLPLHLPLDRGLIKDPDVLRRQNLCNFELCTGSESAPSSSP